jgi:hypothetical protein
MTLNEMTEHELLMKMRNVCKMLGCKPETKTLLGRCEAERITLRLGLDYIDGKVLIHLNHFI